MKSATPSSHPGPRSRAAIRSTLIERLLAIANRHRASSDVLRAIETWVDDRNVDGGYQWVKRQHPEYELAFTQSIRGQDLPVYVDYFADCAFLGMFVYLRGKFTSDAANGLYAVINGINLLEPYGTLELDPASGSLRYRCTVEARGLRLSPVFLDFMLESGLRLFESHMAALLPESIVVRPYSP